MPATAPRIEQEDALMYLSRTVAQEYHKGAIIFDRSHPSPGLYLVLEGIVQVTDTDEQGAMITDLYTSDQFFGEFGLLGESTGSSGMALERSTLMCWSRDEIEDQVQRKPRLGLALMQMLSDRCVEMEYRMQAMALAKTPERVALGLLHFADRLGSDQDNGARRVPPLTHRTIADYVGTSREIVTAQMNRLRSQGLIDYSRKGIDVFREALAADLRQKFGSIANLV